MGDDTAPEARAGLPIQEVSRRLGVPAPTLRAWELRYGVPETPRSAGGHRRYSPDALQRVRLMRDEIGRGHRAADAADAVHSLMAQDGLPRELVDELIAASDAHQSRTITAVLDRAVEELGLGPAVDEVLMPAMRRIGLWEAGRGEISEAHRLTTEAARTWLRSLTAFAPPAAPVPPVILAMGPLDTHVVRLEALGALLLHDTRPCRLLGARTTAEVLVASIRSTGARAVVVVSHLSMGRRHTVETIKAAVDTGAEVFFSGDAFLFARARQGVPGTYLDGTLSSAATAVGRAAVG